MYYAPLHKTWFCTKPFFMLLHSFTFCFITDWSDIWLSFNQLNRLSIRILWNVNILPNQSVLIFSPPQPS